jgi:hypothetical protein
MLALALGALAALQQAPRRVSVSGRVVTGPDSEPVPYSIVSLMPGYPRRLTDDSGRFQFSTVAPGTYRLQVRQIGFAPRDTVIEVRAAGLELRFTLERLGILLPPVMVAATSECVVPGAPDVQAFPEDAAVFGQVVDNARRGRLLADAFPHQLRTERIVTDLELPSRRETSWTDTLDLESAARWQYEPGKIVAHVPYSNDPAVRQYLNPWRDQDLVRLPTLEDFADSSFVANHCFQLAGMDTLAGGRFVRLDFRPAARIKTTDVAGAAYLDSASYMIRYAIVRATHPERGVRGMTSLVATSWFREVVPWIVVTDQLRSVSRTRGTPTIERTEIQRLLRVHFWKAVPRP